ncbi:ABC transporter permease [Streptomyces sp. NA02950]|uniref:ABC transporter permease n=1 Tax=Streptomyces sp. NA02950 TaxID=2742137 RepID=UPI0015914371|nr:ABC transporter permease [Streptomyces sp. NA02950]QKV90521.1 ABC transporter permease [Streptomyces sp. NA02950]
MSPQKTRAITRRVLKELFRDPRSRVVLIITPGLLLLIVRHLFETAADFSTTGVIMVGVFPVFSMFLVGSTAIVRERTRGTLEAILSTPASRLDLVAGYICAAVIASLTQAVITVTVAYWLSDLSTASPPWILGILAMLSGVFGMSLGLLVSAVCQNEGQAFQFLPGVMIPQMLVSGIVWPVADMAEWVQQLERVLPLSAVSRALTAAREHSYGGASMWLSVVVMVGMTAAALASTAATLRRRTA